MVTFRSGKAVLVTRLILIKPKRVSSDHHRHIMKRKIVQHKQGHNGKRFINRRAELLQYSRKLRDSAKLPISKSPTPQPSSSNNQHSKTQAVNARRKPEAPPSCLANCMVSIPSFFKILRLQARKHRNKYNSSVGIKIKAASKSLQVQKRRGFFSKLFLKSRICR